jgi:hypothetical protein
VHRCKVNCFLYRSIVSFIELHFKNSSFLCVVLYIIDCTKPFLAIAMRDFHPYCIKITEGEPQRKQIPVREFGEEFTITVSGVNKALCA